ncbi:MAG: hypothetical protein WBB34_02225 [Xanthobacteraceae bacterium]
MVNIEFVTFEIGSDQGDAIMGAFRATTYSKKELAGLSAAKRKKLKQAIVRQHETHKGVRKLVRQKTKALYAELKG